MSNVCPLAWCDWRIHRVIKDPDQQVQQVIELVLNKFEELGACYRVMRYCQQHDILLPRRHRGAPEPGALRWRSASESIISSIITNPAYAGAFVHGRRTSDPQRQGPGRRTPKVRRPMEQWQCIIHDAYPGLYQLVPVRGQPGTLKRERPALQRQDGPRPRRAP